MIASLSAELSQKLAALNDLTAPQGPTLTSNSFCFEMTFSLLFYQRSRQ